MTVELCSLYGSKIPSLLFERAGLPYATDRGYHHLVLELVYIRNTLNLYKDPAFISFKGGGAYLLPEFRKFFVRNKKLYLYGIREISDTYGYHVLLIPYGMLVIGDELSPYHHVADGLHDILYGDRVFNNIRTVQHIRIRGPPEGRSPYGSLLFPGFLILFRRSLLFPAAPLIFHKFLKFFFQFLFNLASFKGYLSLDIFDPYIRLYPESPVEDI